MLRRITRNEQKIARSRAHRILQDVQTYLREKYIFSWRIVGSGAWGTMIEDNNGEYDLDYQILLTHKSTEYDKDNKKFHHPTQIKNDFYNAFVDNGKEAESFENSTTAVTLINKDNKPYHIDFVIIDSTVEKNKIIRRNNKKETLQINEFTWNDLPDRHEAFEYFKNLEPDMKKYIIEEKVIPAKMIEKEKDESDSTKVSSINIFIQEIMRYKNEF